MVLDLFRDAGAPDRGQGFDITQAVGCDQGMLGFELGDDGALDVLIHANSITVFLSHSEHNFLNDRLRWCAKSKSSRAENAG